MARKRTTEKDLLNKKRSKHTEKSVTPDEEKKQRTIEKHGKRRKRMDREDVQPLPLSIVLTENKDERTIVGGTSRVISDANRMEFQRTTAVSHIQPRVNLTLRCCCCFCSGISSNRCQCVCQRSHLDSHSSDSIAESCSTRRRARSKYPGRRERTKTKFGTGEWTKTHSSRGW